MLAIILLAGVIYTAGSFESNLSIVPDGAALAASTAYPQDRIVKPTDVNPPTAYPRVISAWPENGSGIEQEFRLTYHHDGGRQNLKMLEFMLAGCKDCSEAIYVSMEMETQKIRLGFKGRFGGPYHEGRAGQSVTLSDPHVNIDLSRVRIINLNNNDIMWILPLNFAGKHWSGQRKIFMRVNDLQDLASEYLEMGQFTIERIQGTHRPELISVTPNDGQGRHQHFTFIVRDQDGAEDISAFQILFSTARNRWFDAVNIEVVPSTNHYRLTSFGSFQDRVIGNRLSNELVTVTSSRLSKASDGLRYIYDVDLRFDRRFLGDYNIYMHATDFSARNVGYNEMGHFRVLRGPAIPQGLFIIPGAIDDTTLEARGVRIPLRFYGVWTDLDGTEDLDRLEMKIAASGDDSSNIVKVRIKPNDRTIDLLNNDSDWNNYPVNIGGSITLANANAQLPADLASLSRLSTTQYAVSFGLIFKDAFAGDWNIYMRARDLSGNQGPWRRKGSISIHEANRIHSSPYVVLPVLTTNNPQNFSFEYRDQDGPNDIEFAEVIINSSTGRNPAEDRGIHILYDNRNRSVQFGDERSSHSATLGSDGDLNISRGTLHMDRTIVLLNEDRMKFITRLTFNLTNFHGRKNIWIRCTDTSGHASRWRLLGIVDISSP